MVAMRRYIKCVAARAVTLVGVCPNLNNRICFGSYFILVFVSYHSRICLDIVS